MVFILLNLDTNSFEISFSCDNFLEFITKTTIISFVLYPFFITTCLNSPFPVSSLYTVTLYFFISSTIYFAILVDSSSCIIHFSIEIIS